MKKQFKTVQRTKKEIYTKKHKLLKAAGKFKVGDWIQFTEIGRITEMVSRYGSDDLECQVALVEDTYSPNQPTPPTEMWYKCQECFEEFKFIWELNEHWKLEHAPKRKPKPKTGDKNGKTKATQA